MFVGAIKTGDYNPEQFKKFVTDCQLYGIVIISKKQAGQINPEVFNNLQGLEIIDKHCVCLN